MEMENVFYVNYDGCIQISFDALIIGMWNRYIEYNECKNKICLNNKEFFEKSFNNSYDAAWAATLSGRWDWKDDFVYFGDDGYLTSFSHWDDENSPIDLDKINISPLIDGLKKIPQKNKKEKSISRAIHDALQEV